MNLPSYKFREDLFKRKGIWETIQKHMEAGEIKDFPPELWEKIKNTNIWGFKNLYQVFEKEFNLGACGTIAWALSMCFEEFILVTYGKVPFLAGTKNSDFGQHAWLEVDGYVYDTTLLLKIKREVAYHVLGYELMDTITSDVLKGDKVYSFQKEYSKEPDALISKFRLFKEFEEFEKRQQED